VVSMARRDGDLDSAETSFSILLGPAPHLDGKYTVVGQLVWGEDVLAGIAREPRDERNAPKERIEVEQATVRGAFELEQMRQAGHLRAFQPSAASGKPAVSPPAPARALGGLVFVIACSLAAFALSGRLPPQRIAAINLLAVLVGAFVLLCELGPTSHRSNVLGLALFAGLIALFKLMNRFESPPRAGVAERPRGPEARSR
jgi:hypothetical protein